MKSTVLCDNVYITIYKHCSQPTSRTDC